MRLAVVSHKHCWPTATSPTRYATDGGFPFQMHALSELFDSTRLVVPCSGQEQRNGITPLTGHNLSVVPLPSPHGTGWRRKLGLFPWVIQSGRVLFAEVRRADAVHTPIPGDIGTIGMLMAFMARKPLFVRHCGNWFVQRTFAEHFWKWFIERFAGGRNVMLATGGNGGPPSPRNLNVRWVFSTSLTEQELEACCTPRCKPTDGLLRLIIVCRQDREKGTGVVIESLPLILEEFPRATLDVVGDGEALNEFKQLAASLNISERITFHGKVDHQRVISLLKQADLFCYPTRASEGFPKVVLEALACGLPVITTRVSVLPELIQQGCGVLLSETSPASMADAVRQLLRDAEGYRATSAQAVKTARQYSLESWRDAIGGMLRAAWPTPLRSDD